MENNVEYILHIVTKQLKRSELNLYVANYIQQRKSRSLEYDDLIVINSSNMKDHSYEIEDKDYYFCITGCLLCKGFLQSFHALIVHLYYCHPNITFYFTVKIFIGFFS
jgi:hypothetical protein